MVKDNHNKVYTELMTYLKGLYPDIVGSTVYSETAPKFPYVYFFLVDAPTALTTLSRTEDGINTSYQIEVYSDKGSSTTRKISNSIRAFMVGQGFICRRFRPIERGSAISQFISIYERLDV
jgi:hypothetical protein